MDSRAHRAWIDVDLDALVRNAVVVQRRSAKPVMPMVKADAYGLGALAVCGALESLEPWGYGVATVAEGVELRGAGIARPIVIFGSILPEEFGQARRNRLTPTFGHAGPIRDWVEGGGGPWHLAIDTGMHRAGIEWWRIEEILAVVATSPPEGAFTHLHSADTSWDSVRVQQERFRDAVARLPVRPSLLHVENSPGAERQAPSSWDLVRPGVFLYGVGGGEGSHVAPEPVAHFRARVVELHEVRAGETVSYGGTWVAEGDRKVATVAAGYADGYRRLFSSRGEVLLNGRRAPVVGRVTMDMTMVDVTDVACEVGDVATLIGRAGDDHLDINEIGRAVDLLPYELLVGLKLRAPRLYHGGGAPPRSQNTAAQAVHRNPNPAAPIEIPPPDLP